LLELLTDLLARLIGGYFYGVARGEVVPLTAKSGLFRQGEQVLQENKSLMFGRWKYYGSSHHVCIGQRAAETPWLLGSAGLDLLELCLRARKHDVSIPTLTTTRALDQCCLGEDALTSLPSAILYETIPQDERSTRLGR